MPRLVSIRPVYCLFVTSLFVLGGCQVTTSGQQQAQLETSHSASEIVEVGASGGDQEISPLEQHMLARKDVNPKKVNRKNKFSKTVEDYEREEERRRNEILGDDAMVMANAKAGKPKTLKIEADPIKRQDSAKSYVEAILEKHQARQAALKSDDVAPDDGQYNDQGSNRMVKKVEKKVVKKQVARKPAASDVTNLRVGQHPGKTRIVMDVSDKTKFQVAFENDNQVLVVTMPSASWSAQAKANVAEQSLVRGYESVASGSGSVVKVALNAPGKLAYQKAFKPSGDRGHRIVLDIVAK